MMSTFYRLLLSVALFCQQVHISLQEVSITCNDPSGLGSHTQNGIQTDCAVLEGEEILVRVVIIPYYRRKRGSGSSDYFIATSPARNIPDELIAKPSEDYAHVGFGSDFGILEFSVFIKDDEIVEGPEFLQINVYDPIDFEAKKRRDASNPDGSPAPCLRILIIDNDVCFQLSDNVFVTNEGSTFNFQIKRKGRLNSSQNIIVRTVDITASGGNDYKTLDETILQFTDSISDTNDDGSIVIYTDSKDEGHEMFKIMILSSSEGSIVEPSEAVIIILDSGLFTFDMDHYEVTEGDDVTFRVCRSLHSASDSSAISIQVSDGSAQSSSDYSGVFTMQQIRFDNGADTSEAITISTTEDSHVEHRESFEIALVTNDEQISTATVWIYDDDVRYCFESLSYVVSEGDDSLTLTIVKEGNLQDTTQLSLTTSDIDATSIDDYMTFNPPSVIVQQGMASIQVQLDIRADTIWEPTECFKVNILIGDDIECCATITIKDDDVCTCENDGVCVAPDKCLCPRGFIGDRCERVCTCENDGVCVAPDKCLCPRGFIGDRCERALCDPACRNGGTCIAPNTCLCSEQFTGPICETASCHQLCENGGICIASTKCWCRQGFTGERCETSLCNPSCQNGGLCSDTGNCLCPNGFMGPQCRSALSVSNGVPTSNIGGQFSITSIDGEPAVFTPDLNVEGSEARDELISKILPMLNELFGPMEGFRAVVIVSFGFGSIIVEFAVTLDSGSQTSASDVENTINTFIQTAPSSGLVINPDPAITFTSAGCVDGYCKNGGTCTTDATGRTNTCTCTRGYSGPQCGDKENLSVGAVAGIIIGLVGAIILAILIGICVCIFMRQTKTQPTVPTPNLNTLDLAPYPYVFPRVDASGAGLENTLMF